MNFLKRLFSTAEPVEVLAPPTLTTLDQNWGISVVENARYSYSWERWTGQLISAPADYSGIKKLSKESKAAVINEFTRQKNIYLKQKKIELEGPEVIKI